MSDALDQTPEYVLETALAECASSVNPPDKCLVLFLWDDRGIYDTRFFNAGMSSSQCVALLAVNQAKFIELMRGPTQ